MPTVFTSFKETDYEYLTISRGTVYGNRIISSVTHKGIFKLRSGMTQGTMEVANSQATLHVHPEDYSDYDDLVGNGIRYDGVTYRISGVTGGRNFDDGKMEHLRLTLEVETYTDGASNAGN